MRIFLAIVIFLAGCSSSLDGKNGTWDCGSAKMKISDNDVNIEFIDQGNTVKEVGRLTPHNDLGYALAWDVQNKFWIGTSQAVFSSTKVIPDKLVVLGIKQLTCTKI